MFAEDADLGNDLAAFDDPAPILKVLTCLKVFLVRCYSAVISSSGHRRWSDLIRIFVSPPSLLIRPVEVRDHHVIRRLTEREAGAALNW